MALMIAIFYTQIYVILAHQHGYKTVLKNDISVPLNVFSISDNIYTETEIALTLCSTQLNLSLRPLVLNS